MFRFPHLFRVGHDHVRNTLWSLHDNQVAVNSMINSDKCFRPLLFIHSFVNAMNIGLQLLKIRKGKRNNRIAERKNLLLEYKKHLLSDALFI